MSHRTISPRSGMSPRSGIAHRPPPAMSLAIALVFVLAIGPDVGAQIPTRQQIDAAAALPLPSDPATPIAVVGNHPVLLGELMPRVDTRIAAVMEQSGQEVPEDQLRFVKIQMLRQLLAQTVQTRMMRESFLLDQVGAAAADKRLEAEKTLAAKARQAFYETELPTLKEKHNVTTNVELDRKLRGEGSSLAAKQREFTDAMLGHFYMKSKVEQNPHVSLSEIYAFYDSQPKSFAHPARARWEQLTVTFEKHPDRAEAQQAITAMGREAYFGGNLQAVARKSSEEPFAADGGLHEWTNKGSLASVELEEQIFSLPTGGMSPIIQDATGLHIIRVLEREEAGREPLSAVQEEIKEQLQRKKVSASQRELIESLQRRVPVWSLYPDDIPGAKPMPNVAAAAGTLRR